MQEIWKDVVGYEGIYKVSNIGRIKSLSRYVNNSTMNKTKRLVKEKILSQSIGTHGYYSLILSSNNNTNRYTVHRLVAKSFIANNKNKPCVNHIDGNKLNNNIENLEWCTYQENEKHAFRIGLKTPTWLGKFGSNHHRSVKIIQLSLDGHIIKKHNSIVEAGRSLGIKPKLIHAACKGKSKTSGGFKWIYD